MSVLGPDWYPMKQIWDFLISVFSRLLLYKDIIIIIQKTELLPIEHFYMSKNVLFQCLYKKNSLFKIRYARNRPYYLTSFVVGFNDELKV